MIYRLKELIERLASSPQQPSDGGGPDLMQRALAKAHLELARIGSRVAISDLRDALVDPARPVELELLAAVELIGTRNEIGDLLRAYVQEDDFTRERIGAVVRAIMKRERIRRNNKLFRTLSREQQRALAGILPPVPRRRRRDVQP